jgi:hypothetical protein
VNPSSLAAADIALVHLVWAPLGPKPLQAFLRSYSAHPAGAEHELVLVVNGIGLDKPRASSTGTANDVTPLSRKRLAAELGEIPHSLIELERPLLDLAAYGEAARRLEHERLCFVNSYSVILADGWLGHLARVFEQPGVGLVGATGSWESRSELVHGSALHWAYQLAKLPAKRRGFPRFPNPHIRTTAFMLDRRLALELGLDRVHDKDTAYLLESGRDSITRQLQRRGLQTLVVGRDGYGYASQEWSGSRTFRAGAQSNLLVADNRTSQWQSAGRELQRSLSYQAWRHAEPE